MKLLRLRTTDVAPLPDRTYELAHPDTGEALDVVVIAGPPASGKTSLLEAIVTAKEAVAPYGSPAMLSSIAAGATSAKIEAEWALSPAETRRVGDPARPRKSEALLGAWALPRVERDPALTAILGGYAHDPDIGKIEYFHAGRVLPPSSASPFATGTTASSERRIRFSKSADKYRGVRQLLLEHAIAERLDGSGPGAEGARPPFTERFTKALGALCETTRFDGVDRTADGFRARFVGASGQVVDLDRLSDSERQAVIFAATFAHLELHGSIVLVDVPELFLPASEVVRFATALTGLGRDNQLVFATSSAELVAAVEPHQVVRLGAAARR